jgi:hypothetical protein
MSIKWWHILGLLVLGILIDYFMPALANMSLGKLTPRKS